MANLNHLGIPASYIYYLRNQNPLTILDNNKEPFPDFTLLKTVEFFKAKGCLDVCKQDYYRLCVDLFNVTWGVAIKKHGGRLKELSFSEIKQINNKNLLSPEGVWKTAFSWAYECDGYLLFLGAYDEVDGRLGVYFSINQNASGHLEQLNSEFGVPNNNNERDVVDSHRVTIPKDKEEDITVDVSSLAEAAEKAIKEILSYIESHAKQIA